MKIKAVLYSVIFFFLYIFTSVTPLFTVNGAAPQLLFCGIVAVAMFESEKVAAVFSIIFGMLADFASGTFFGLNTIIFILSIFFMSLLFTKLLTVNVLTYFAAASFMLLLSDVVYFMFDAIFTDGANFAASMMKIALPKLVITIPFMFLIYLIFKAIGTKREWRTYDERY